MTLPDFQPAPNQAGDPELYELENRAMDPDGLVLGAMRELAPWAGRTLVDLGCGSGYWLPGYADEADRWLASHPGALGLGYGYVLFCVSRTGDTTARSG
jgi:hypothetical protein